MDETRRYPPATFDAGYGRYVTRREPQRPVRSQYAFRDLIDELRDVHPLHWAGDTDQDQDAWDMAFDAMYDTGWALEEDIEDRQVTETYRRWQREQGEVRDRGV